MKKQISHYIQKTHQAFTLLEMLFAVIIFSFALVSLIGITGKGVVATITAKNQLTAQYLAEELIEVARNVRDSNYIAGNAAWDTGITENCTKENPCGVDYSQKPVLKTGRETLYENNGVFGPADIIGGGDESIFSRELYFESIGTGNQGMLVSTVRWQEKEVERKFELKTYIADWQTASSTTP